MDWYHNLNITASYRKFFLLILVLCSSISLFASPLKSNYQQSNLLTNTKDLLPVSGSDSASLISVLHLPPPTIDSWDSREQLPSLRNFSSLVTNGQANIIRGVYIPGFLALPVVQQPSGNTGFVSGKPETVTQFQLAARYGVIGFLAHNYLAGNEFYRLMEGLEVFVINGNGARDRYQVTKIKEYQKLSPGSNWSHYIDLETGERLTTYQVFGQYYQGDRHVTFQTCIAKNGIETWGLRFVVAEPIN